jgi:ABC-type maltose transport system permease subunit
VGQRSCGEVSDRIERELSRTLLVVQMFPLILAIIPLFILFRNLNMVNNFIPVVAGATAGAVKG